MVRPTLNIGFPVRILRRILHWMEPDSMAPLRRTAFAIQRAQSDMVARKCGRRAGEAAERLLHKHPRSAQTSAIEVLRLRATVTFAFSHPGNRATLVPRGAAPHFIRARLSMRVGTN